MPVDHLLGSTFVGVAGGANRRIELRVQQDGRLLLRVQGREAGELYEVPHSRVSLNISEVGDLITNLIEARHAMSRA